MQNVPDPYRLLGVGRDATTSQIKAAHRRLAKRYHPDAPEGDQQRFLAVQEAYQLLADPVQRNQWDARHAPGPVRADAGAPRMARSEGARRTAGPATRSRAATRPTEQQRAASPGRSGPTWSARNVPWWEAREAAARQAASEGRTGQGRRRHRPQESGDARRPADAAAGDVPRSEFDVYSRSSGAAWSSAARAYFRKGVDDLPRGRAAWANRPRPRRPAESPWEETGDRSDRSTAEPDGSASAGGGAARPSASTAARGRERAEPARESGPAPAAGTVPRPRFTAQGPYANLARARRSAIVGRGQWPPAFQRLVFAVAGWLPPALALAYTSASATGCDRASVSCPPNFELVQVVAVAALLGGLLAFPRAAYLAAAGSAGLGLTALLLVIVYGVIGVPQPLPDAFALLTLGLWLIGYVGGVMAARHDWPFERPWLREAWVVGPNAAPPSLGVAHRAPRG